MSASSGPNLVTDGLILDLDPTNIKNAKISSTNYFSNAAFSGGVGIPQESGSNPTNEIVQLANPGDSDYVLRQNGNYTEYQINLTPELSASTTYVMSGWYATSADYNGSDTMFHARAHSASGAHISTGTDIGTVIYSVTIGDTLWRYCYKQITTPSDYTTFAWFVGYGQTSHTGYRYYTNLKLEKGTFPSLVDFSKNNNHHYHTGTVNYSNGIFTLNGSDSGFVRESSLNNVSSSCTVVLWYKTTDSQELWVRGNQNNSWYLSASSGNNYYHANCGTPINYVDCKQVFNPWTEGYRNGSYHMWEAKSVNLSGWNYFDWFLYPSGWQMSGSVAKILVYNRNLTTDESRQNYAALRGRYGI